MADLAVDAPRVDHRRVLPDQGCYEEHYRLTGSAVLGLTASLLALGLGFLWHTQVIFGVISALLLVLVALGSGVVGVARRAVAFRADYAGITLGAVPGTMPRRPAVFVPWADVEQIVVYSAEPSRPGGHQTAWCIGIRRREGALALAEGNEHASGCPVPGVAAGATRRVTGWRLDRERLAAVTAVMAPGVPITDVSGIEGTGRTASTTEVGPPEQD
jgi:hypothetical protein